MKKPWYIWLSVLTCMYLFSVLSVKVRFKVKPFDIGVWVSFCGHIGGAWFLYVMLIPGLYAFLLSQLQPYIGNKTVDEILYYSILVVLYFGGVYAAGRIYQWGHARRLLK